MSMIYYNPRSLDVGNLSEEEIETLELIYKKRPDRYGIERLLSELEGQKISVIMYDKQYTSFQVIVNHVSAGFVQAELLDGTSKGFHITSCNFYHPAILSYLKCI